MSDARQAWTDVGNDLNALAMKLKLHYEQAAGEETAAAREAVHRLREALDDAFEALGSAAKDPALRDDARRVGSSLGNALSETFAQAGDELSKAFRRGD